MSKENRLRDHLRFTRQELPSLIGVITVVALLHIVGWGLFIHYNSNPAYSALADSSGALVYAGAGALAYSFGLRHAFDADHIAAIDDTTRLMLAKGKNPIALGLFSHWATQQLCLHYVSAWHLLPDKLLNFKKILQKLAV